MAGNRRPARPTADLHPELYLPGSAWILALPVFLQVVELTAAEFHGIDGEGHLPYLLWCGLVLGLVALIGAAVRLKWPTDVLETIGTVTALAWWGQCFYGNGALTDEYGSARNVHGYLDALAAILVVYLAIPCPRPVKFLVAAALSWEGLTHAPKAQESPHVFLDLAAGLLVTNAVGVYALWIRAKTVRSLVDRRQEAADRARFQEALASSTLDAIVLHREA